MSRIGHQYLAAMLLAAYIKGCPDHHQAGQFAMGSGSRLQRDMRKTGNVTQPSL